MSIEKVSRIEYEGKANSRSKQSLRLWLRLFSCQSFVEDKIPEYSKKFKGEEQYPTTFMWGQDFPLGMK